MSRNVDYVDDWFLMKSPFLLIFITSCYLTFVLKVGPAYMKDRRPFNVTKILILYNTFQVLYSVYLCIEGTDLIWFNGLLCPSCLMDTKESRYLITSRTYFYFLAKVSELLDTIFFVLRKKDNQVTFLHVYHHSLMMWSTWLTLKYEPTYNTIFLGTLNSFVHVIMYTYYGLSAFPELEKYLWWKRYITKMQLTQFVVILLHAMANLRYSGCPPSNTLLITIVANVIIFIYLFGKFYINAYMKSKGKNVKLINNNNVTHDIKSMKSK
ncbi:elongation of very long chain fatty acids protein 7 isoform X2 [Bicyclus anynana]|uniref:Elongation of very long chain fatty acids protein n=1 Tax=Bicyclus anynana TaxID=110368 RepID=A0A6J1MRS2_BICAN|nr:elongation of very long chain fatty acids protein 7 isoform X2 [Bicyclus anynana]